MIFSSLSSIKQSQPQELGYRFGRLAQIDFDLFFFALSYN